MMLTVGLFLWAWLATVGGVFVNRLDEPFTFSCPSNQAISRIYSVHNNGAEDRQFDFTCRTVDTDSDGTQDTCFWTDYVNKYDELVHFVCPTNNYLAGVDSIHANSAEDRIFKFRCCSSRMIHEEDCQLSGYTNDWDGPSDFSVDAGKVMKGVISEHNNGAEDRKFEYVTCTVRRGSGSEVIG